MDAAAADSLRLSKQSAPMSGLSFYGTLLTLQDAIPAGASATVTFHRKGRDQG